MHKLKLVLNKRMYTSDDEQGISKLRPKFALETELILLKYFNVMRASAENTVFAMFL